MNILRTTVLGSSFTGSCEKRVYRLITDFKEKNELLNVLLKITVVKLHLFYLETDQSFSNITLTTKRNIKKVLYKNKIQVNC